MTFAQFKSTCCALVFTAGSLLAQSGDASKTAVQTKTFDQDGQKVTERTTISPLNWMSKASKCMTPSSAMWNKVLA